MKLRLIPFFAVDSKGNPVTDLRPDEVEILIDGRPIKIAHFDRYLFTGQTAETVAAGRSTETPSAEAKPETGASPTGSVPASSVAPPIVTPRNVFLVFDLAFSTLRGFRRSRDLAMDLVNQLLDTDRIYIFANRGLHGFAQIAGPLKGRARVREVLARLLGMHKAVDRAPEAKPDFEPETSGAASGGHEKFEGVDLSFDIQQYMDEIRAFNETQYARMGSFLAEAIRTLGTSLKQLPGPKMMYVFSQGIRKNVYFEGVKGVMAESPFGAGGFISGPLQDTFEKPLKILSDSGTMTMFIDTEAALNTEGGADTLRHMAHVTGGMYMGGTSLRELREQIIRWTGAYYEAGFYLKKVSLKGKRHSVEVRVRRPGIRVWTVRSFSEPKAYRYFSKEEKTLFALDLAAFGELGVKMVPADAVFHRLKGRPGARMTDEGRLLHFAVRWPQALPHKDVELLSVLYRARGPNRLGQPFNVSRRKLKPKDGLLVVEETVPTQGGFIWCIAAVAKKTGDIFWNRWFVKPPAHNPGKEQPARHR